MKAFKMWSQAEFNPENIPATVPFTVQDCVLGEQLTLESLGYTVMSDEDYASYVSSQDPIIAAWQASKSKVISPVTNQQLRTALVLISFQQSKPNLHPDAIKSFIETLSEPNRSLALQQWEYSNEMLRSNALVNSLASSLGLTSADLDNIWTYAATL